MQTQAKAIRNATTVGAGSPAKSETKFPHSSKAITKRPSIFYLSMMKEVEKIANPVRFRGLKQFYNMV